MSQPNDPSAPVPPEVTSVPAPEPKRYWPVVTTVIVGLSVAATAAVEFLPESVSAWLYGSNYDLWLRYEWWKPVTSTFVHIGILHLFFNCYWLWAFGLLLEPTLGRGRYLLIFLLTAWFGSIAELAATAQTGVGLSGVVYGVFGFLLVNRWRHPAFAALLSKANIAVLLGWLVLCFPLTYSGTMNIANFAHLGGFISGLLLGWAIPPGRWRWPACAGIAALGIASFVPLLWAPWHEDWQLVVAQRALDKEDFAQALPAVARVRQRYPDYLWAWHVEAALRTEQHHYRLARDLWLGLVQRTNEPEYRNNLAWLLATCPAEDIRDGARAIEYAQEACEATQWKNAAYLDTLAAAHAESGDFAAAVRWQEEALQLAAGSEAETELKVHLETFRAGRPWREEGPTEDQSPDAE